MKKYFSLSMVLLVSVATFFTGCTSKDETTSNKSNISVEVEKITEKEVQETSTSKEADQTSKKESILPEDLSNIIGKAAEEIQKEKGAGEEDYLTEGDKKHISSITYNEKWFNWDEEVKTTYAINAPDGDTVVSMILRFSDNTDRAKLVKHISGYLGEAQEKQGGETNAYSAQWDKDGFTYYLADYGYLEMYINKIQ